MNTLEQLRQPPKPEHIKLVNGDGEHIPIGILENELDEIFTFWNTGNYVFSKMLMPDGKLAIDASIELSVLVNDTNGVVVRSGACSFFASGMETGIEANYAAIAKSECICNAAKSLGIRLGRGLNNRLNFEDQMPPVPKQDYSEEDIKNTFTLKNK